MASRNSKINFGLQFPEQTMARITNQTWSIEILDDWEIDPDEPQLTILSPEGIGELRISAYSKDDPITPDDVLDLIDLDAEARNHLREGRWGDFDGFQLNYSTDNQFCRSFWVYSKQTLLFITYMCDVSEKEIEQASINSMLKSLKLLTDSDKAHAERN